MFIRFVIGLVLSTYGFYQFSQLPSAGWLVVLFILLILIWIYRHTVLKFSASYFFIGAIIGFQLAFLQNFISPIVPDKVLSQKIEVFGEVIGLPVTSQTSSFSEPDKEGRPKVRFDFVITQIKVNNQQINWHFNRPKVRLNWFSPEKAITPGKNQHFLVKLRPNRASFNLGGFDYETYLFKESIAATGYIIKDLSVEKSLVQEFNLRFWLAEHLKPLLEDSPFKGIFKALIYGDRADISSQDWQMLQQTGTIHLMAISGLHVGLIAGIGFLLLGMLWSVLVGYSRWVFNTPKVYWAALGALSFASVYLILAGASIPTQRAWLMVVAVLVFVVIKRKFQPSSALALAAFLVVIWEPKSVLSPGFWLSFTAVALIFAFLFYFQKKPLNKWQLLLAIQILLSIGLVPFVAFYYGQFPAYSIIANLVAVPFVTMIGLPLLFLTVVVSFISEFLAQQLMWLNNVLWSWLWVMLYWVADLKFNIIPLKIATWQLVIFYAGIFIFLARNIRYSWVIGLVLMIIAVGFSLRTEPQPNVRMAVLDVGQAQAVVFTTQNHVVIYDTGDFWSKKLDGGKMAVLPYLQALGRQQVDLMIISHSDLDHAGGMRSILKDIAVQQAISGQPQELNQLTSQIVFKSCVAGQSWQFDQLSVEVIAPLQDWEVPKKDNDTSCVVKFSVADSTILIMGDLSKRYEKKLLKSIAEKYVAEKLTADILVAGHHGSKTSTSLQWLQQVNPSEVVFTAGYLNRFKHPHPKVIKNVVAINAIWWNTACEGDVSYEHNGKSWIKQQSYRKSNLRWYHHRCSEAEKGLFHQGIYN